MRPQEIQRVLTTSRLLLAVSFLLLTGSAHAQAPGSILTGKVIRIADGDTFTIIDANHTQHKIRPSEIDAPENGQPYGNKSKQTLKALIAGKQVSIKVDHPQALDRYGRVLGRPSVGTIDVSKYLVSRGAAWVSPKYGKDPELFRLQDQAKAQRVGVWGLSEAQRMAPWEWRRHGNADAAPTGCKIKGNISKGGRIYHLPGARGYGRVKISPKKSERYFCTEDEARAAGWRASRAR